MTITNYERAYDFLCGLGYTRPELALLEAQDRIIEEANDQYGTQEASREKEYLIYA